jgi:2,3-bisphosphoglycerate-dependent phosphoglycerate mutase
MNFQKTQGRLENYVGKTIVVGSHGTALSTIVNYYDNSFGYAEFEKIRGLMPWVVEFNFVGLKCVGIKQYNLFEVEG